MDSLREAPVDAVGITRPRARGGDEKRRRGPNYAFPLVLSGLCHVAVLAGLASHASTKPREPHRKPVVLTIVPQLAPASIEGPSAIEQPKAAAPKPRPAAPRPRAPAPVATVEPAPAKPAPEPPPATSAPAVSEPATEAALPRASALAPEGRVLGAPPALPAPVAPGRGAAGAPAAELSDIAPAGTAAAALAGYRTTLGRYIERVLRYPEQARRRRLSGDVQIEVLVDARGHVLSTRVVESPHSLLSDAACAALIAASPLPPPPPGLGVPARLVIPLSFDLRS